MAGGLGAKKVDVSLASEEIGLVFALSIKGIYFPDLTLLRESDKVYFAKNFVNRKGDVLAEATNLHKRFPYAVLGGLFFFDERAARDNQLSKFEGIASTYDRAHKSFLPFSNRASHADAEESYDLFALGLCSTDPPSYSLEWVGKRHQPITLDDYLHRLLRRVAELNGDYYDFDGKQFVDLRKRKRKIDLEDQVEDETGD